MHDPLDVPVWTIAPFAALLVTIAVMPALAGRFWHGNGNKALIIALFSVPVAAYLVVVEFWTAQPGGAALAHGLQEYASFMVLLASLYIVAGGILIEGDVRPSPRNNVLLLAAGILLANLIGTTGASVILIRLFLRMNASRRTTRHLTAFFIFTVSNLGGLLTPLGDPPLFLGFLRGVSFFWTMRLWPEWLLVNGLVLAVFYGWEALAFRRERIGMHERQPAGRARLRIRGLVNAAFLAGILAAVLLQSAAFSQALTGFGGQLFPFPDMHLSWPFAEAIMALMALLSLACTPRGLRAANQFRWQPIVEVAVLFAGIFITMVPALAVLASPGRDMGLMQPWQYFWATGGLSAFLDNAPTYVTFASMAAGAQPIGSLMADAPRTLAAISCGAVFLGAMTYVGNGPNFMVKAIAEEHGFNTPSFFGYVLYAAAVLLPIFVLVSVLFFRGP